MNEISKPGLLAGSDLGLKQPKFVLVAPSEQRRSGKVVVVVASVVRSISSPFRCSVALRGASCVNRARGEKIVSGRRFPLSSSRP
jgi:hypothetical protein